MEEIVFKQSITRLGSVLRPDVIKITEDHITWIKRNKNLINQDEKTFHIEKITSIEIDSSFFGTTILINTIDGDTLKLEKFTISDAKEIKKTIENLQAELRNPKPKETSTIINNTGDKISQLYKLKELLDSGLIDEKEFKELKSNIL